MQLRKKWNSLPIFWQTYWLTVLLVAGIVSGVELLSELFSLSFLPASPDHSIPLYELIFWGIGIIFPSLLSGWVLSRFLNRQLEGLAKTSSLLAKGQLTARMEMVGNPQDAFFKVATSFNTMARQIEKLLQNERRLLTDISHELRSPLTRMNMALTLTEPNAPPSLTRHLDTLSRNVARMEELVELLLQHGELILRKEERERVQMEQIIKEVSTDADFEGAVAGKKVTAATKGALMIEGSPVLLRTMLANIVNNALAYAPEDSTIEVSGRKAPGNIIVIEVRDYGPGVPARMLEDIFRAFYRVDDSRTRETGGVGLGLAIAKQIVESHGGNIMAENAVPGLLLRVQLPLIAEAELF